MKNLIKKVFSLALTMFVMITGLTPAVFADDQEKHYYDFNIDEDGMPGRYVLGLKDIELQGTIDEEMQEEYYYYGKRLATMYGGLAYGTGYAIELPVINYRAGGSTIGEVEYFKDGAVAIVRVDQVKRKADRLEAITLFKPINSGQDDESLFYHCNNSDDYFRGAVGSYLEMTDFSNLERSHVYDNKNVALSKVFEYEVFFDNVDYLLINDRFKINKVNWYNLEQASLFSDVPDDHWAVLEINKCKDLGLVSGIGEDRYAPNFVLTKAEVMQVLYNLYYRGEQLDSDIKINDVADEIWYAKAIKWGVENEIVGLANNNFDPDGPASREWTCNAFFRTAYKKGSGLPNWLAKSPEDGFYDMQDKSKESQIAVVALQNAEIISGFPDELFHPDESLTRAQLAMILNNYAYAQAQLDDDRYLSEEYDF